MKNHLLLLLSVAILMSCKKDIIEPASHKVTTLTVVKVPEDTTVFIKTITAVEGYTSTQIVPGTTNQTIGEYHITIAGNQSKTVTGLHLLFCNRAIGDYKLADYATSVSVFVNGNNVGSMPVTALTMSNHQFTGYLSLSKAVLLPDSINDISIKVSALPVIDAANLDLSQNTFAFEIEDFIYTNANAAHLYAIPLSQRFDTGNILNGAMISSFVFAKPVMQTPTLTIQGDVNNTDRIVQASKYAPVLNNTVAYVDAIMYKSIGIFNTLHVHVAVNNTGTGSTNANAFVTRLRLYDPSGHQIDSEIVPAGSYPEVVFQKLNFLMAAGSTSMLTIKADVAAVDGTIVAQGTSVRIDITPEDVLHTQAWNGNNMVIAGKNLLGGVVGPTSYFYVNGIVVSPNGPATVTVAAPGGSLQHDVITMVIKFSVTAYGQNAYIPSAASFVKDGTITAPQTTDGPSIQYVVDDGTSLLKGASAHIEYNGTDVMYTTNNGNYQVPVGQTKNFTLVITYSPTVAGSYQGRLVNVNSNSTDSATKYDSDTVGLNKGSFFVTNYITAQ